MGSHPGNYRDLFGLEPVCRVALVYFIIYLFFHFLLFSRLCLYNNMLSSVFSKYVKTIIEYLGVPFSSV